MTKIDLSREANLFRKEMGEDAYSPIDIFAMALRIKDTTTVFAELGKNISGIFCRTTKSNIIIINSEMTLGRQRFSMAHELYHWKYDKEAKTIVCATTGSRDNLNERKADIFAANLLMPRDGLFMYVEELKAGGEHLSLADVIKLEQYFQVSHSAMLIRLKDEKLITSSEYAQYCDRGLAKAEMITEDLSLYRKTGENKTKGYYLKKAKALYDEGKIGDSKYAELLKDAFMEDIITGELEIGEDTFEQEILF